MMMILKHVSTKTNLEIQISASLHNKILHLFETSTNGMEHRNLIHYLKQYKKANVLPVKDVTVADPQSIHEEVP